MEKVNLADKLRAIDDYWEPRIAAELNGQHVRLAKLEGEFIWHAHPNEDELFLVLEGRLTIAFRDGEVSLEPGEFIVVPRGVEHKPRAEEETHVMLFEPATTLNTGDRHDERTRSVLKRA